jgi:tRNA 2-selenouridine synthase
MRDNLDVNDFLARAKASSIIDVRSPGEFQRGHIPDAHNVPLFTDDERAQVGICYKEEGRDAAVLLGLDIVGPKMRALVEHSREVSIDASPLIHCWRGGMRSSSVAWLLEQADMTPSVLEGGYKSFRRAAGRSFAAEWRIVILSGMTGAGKTRILHELASVGEQVLDLEGIANHRGSSFGGIGLPPQPTCEQFENNVYWRLRACDPARPMWIEDESHSIGKVRVPDELWCTMRQSPAIFVDVDRNTRVKNLAEEYGSLDADELAAAIQRLRGKLGGLRTSEALKSLDQGIVQEVAHNLLEYYDKTYQHAAQKRPRDQVHRIGAATSIEQLIQLGQRCHLNRIS